MQAGEFKTIRDTGTPRAEILEDYGPDTISVETYYLDRDDNVIARVHHYEPPEGGVLFRDENGVLRTDGKPDPKTLFEDGVLYHQEKKKSKIGSRSAQEYLHERHSRYE